MLLTELERALRRFSRFFFAGLPGFMPNIYADVEVRPRTMLAEPNFRIPMRPSPPNSNAFRRLRATSVYFVPFSIEWFLWLTS
jgi:hypothetical protein